MTDIHLELAQRKELSSSSDVRDVKYEQRELIEKEVTVFLDRSFTFFEQHRVLPKGKFFALLQAGAGIQDVLHIDGETPLDEGRSRIRIFFDVFVDFCARIHRIPEKRAALHAFLTTWNETAFVDAFGQPVTALELDDMMKLGLHLSRIPETHDNFAGNARQAFLFTLERTKDIQARKNLLNKIWEHLSLEDQIDFTEYVLTLYFHLESSASEDVVLRDVQFWEDFLQDIVSRKDTSAFVQYGARYALNIIHSSPQRWSRFMRAYSDHGGRFHPVDPATRKEGAVWKRVLKPDANSYVDIYARRIAKDAVATFDNAWAPQSFTYVDTNEERERVPREAHFALFEDIPDRARVQVKGVDRSVGPSVLLQAMHRPGIRLGIEKDLGISLNQLSLREQIQLLTYLARVDQKTAHDGFAIIQKHGLNAARTFLSCEHGKHFGDAILDIAKKLDLTSAKAVFAKYCEIVDATERTTEELLSEFYVTENGREIDRGKVNEEILVRAKEVLALCAKELQGAGENPVAGADILKKLESVQKDTILFASLFKDIARNNCIEFSEMKGVAIEQRFGGELAAEERSAMMDIFCENWVQVDPDTFRELKVDFEQALGADAQTAFSILKRDRRVIAFIGFESQGDGVVRADYFNTTSTARGALIGEAFLRRALADREQDAREIVAEVAPLADVASAYIERFGFVGVMPDADANAEGKEKWMYLNRSAAIRDALTSRQSSVDLGVIRSWIERGHAPNGIIVEKYAGTSEEDFLGLVRRRLRSGTVLSRYIIEKSVRPPVRYVVFEPVPTAASVSVAA